MPSRQDQLHSYQYSQQRVVAALVNHDPDPARSPLRRAGTTALVSLLIASLAVVAYGVYGAVAEVGTKKIEDPTVIFQERGTGARFVYRDDKLLHPVLNYASAMLLATGQPPKMQTVSPDTLAKVQHGAPLGIPGAPDSLPDKKRLIVDGWSVCTGQSPNGGLRSTLLIGDALSGGTVLAKERSLLVEDPAHNTFVVVGNHRYGVPPDPSLGTLDALHMANQTPMRVSAAWINAIPLGPDLRPPKIPGIGGSSAVAGYQVGDVVSDGDEDTITDQHLYKVILADGAVNITSLQAALLSRVHRVKAIGNATFSALRPLLPGRLDSDIELPKTIGQPWDSTPSTLCMTLSAGAATATSDGVRVDPNLPDVQPVTGVAPMPGDNQADVVYVEAAKGAVVSTAAPPGVPENTGTVGIVTDEGRLYPLANRDLLVKLGYGGITPQPIPAQLIALLPTGPSLDPARAAQPVTPRRSNPVEN